MIDSVFIFTLALKKLTFTVSRNLPRGNIKFHHSNGLFICLTTALVDKKEVISKVAVE